MTLKESRVDHSYRVVKIHGSGPFKRRIMDMATQIGRASCRERV